MRVLTENLNDEGRLQRVRALVEKGGNPGAQDGSGRSALLSAIEGGCDEVGFYLPGADPGARSRPMPRPWRVPLSSDGACKSIVAAETKVPRVKGQEARRKVDRPCCVLYSD